MVYFHDDSFDLEGGVRILHEKAIRGGGFSFFFPCRKKETREEKKRMKGK
jgi:hypothetical protein